MKKKPIFPLLLGLLLLLIFVLMSAMNLMQLYSDRKKAEARAMGK